jgi:hypothetical protein
VSRRFALARHLAGACTHVPVPACLVPIRQPPCLLESVAITAVSYASGGAPPITSTLVAWYEADSMEGYTCVDKSGAGNNASVSGSVPRTILPPDFGAKGLIQGGISTSITLPFVLPSTYTLFHLARYGPGTAVADRRELIVMAPPCDFASGFYAPTFPSPTATPADNGTVLSTNATAAYVPLTGVARHGGAWLTQSATDLHGANWVLSTDQWGMYRSQGFNRTVSTPGAFCSAALGVNGGGVDGAFSSGWQLGAMLVYSSTLNATEIATVETWLITRFALGKCFVPNPPVFMLGTYFLPRCFPWVWALQRAGMRAL